MHSRLPDGINEYSQISRTLAVGRQVDQVLEACQDIKVMLREDSVCYCGLTAKLRTAHTEKNYGRRFIRCPQPLNNQCKFFKWVSDI
jgi:hypothetical protein